MQTAPPAANMTCPKQHNPDLSAKGLSAGPACGMVSDEPVLADVGTLLEQACTTCTSPLGVFKSGRFYSGYCFSCSRIARDCRASPLLAGALRTNYGDVVPDIERLLTMPLSDIIQIVDNCGAEGSNAAKGVDSEPQSRVPIMAGVCTTCCIMLKSFVCGCTVLTATRPIKEHSGSTEGELAACPEAPKTNLKLQESCVNF